MGKEKDKIDFLERTNFENAKDFDFAFIDGNHSDENIILSDFELCRNVLDNNGVIVWDDYENSSFVVKNVIDTLVEKEKFFVYLVYIKGHLFGNKYSDGGLVLMSKKKLF